MNQPKPELLFFPFDLLSHYARSLELARQFESEYRISFKSSERYNHLIRARGYDIFECRDFNAEHVNECMRKFSFKWINERDVDSIYQDQVKVLEQVRPAMVIGDMAPTLKMACEKTGIKYVSLINGYMSKYYALERPVGETHPAYFIKRWIPADIFSKVAARQEQKAFEKIHKPFRMLRNRNGLSARSTYLDELEGDETLICDHEQIFPLRNPPSAYRYTGPLLVSAVVGEREPFTRIDGKKTILITMGSSGEWSKLTALNEKEFARYHFIVLGDKHRVLNADHFQHFDHVDLRSVLGITDLAICHGGNGTLNFCFEMKVPFIALPSMIEQEWNALRFQEVMKGLTLAKRPSSLKLSESIAQLLASEKKST